VGTIAGIAKRTGTETETGTGTGLAGMACAILGHEMDNRTLAGDARHPRCGRCREPFLHEDGGVTHTRHVLGCFRYLCNLFGHHVHAVGERHGLTEYACGCGHSFLLAPRGLAKVTHPLICTVSGHRVVFVERREAYREHRCVDCGHTFGVAA